MGQPWPAAILFDFDGVIVNSEPLHFLAFHEVLASEQIELTEREYFEELIGFDDRGAIKHVFEKRGRALDAKTWLRLLTVKSRAMLDLIHRRKVSALPGVEAFVRGVWRHYPLGICSGALREEIEIMLEGVALRDCFSVIVAAEDVAVGKPDPAGYRLTAQLLGEKWKHAIAPEDCLVVEDSIRVAESVGRAGFRTLGVATSRPMEQWRGVGDWAVRSLEPDEVLGVLPELRIYR